MNVPPPPPNCRMTHAGRRICGTNSVSALHFAVERANCRKDEPNRSSGDASYGSALRDDVGGEIFIIRVFGEWHCRIMLGGAAAQQHLSHACSLILRRASSFRMDFVAHFNGFAPFGYEIF